MKYFETLQKLTDYVPNCVICGKDLSLLIEGHWGSRTDFRSIKTFLKEDLIYSKHRIYNFCINPKNNEVLSGQEYFKVMTDRYVVVYKKCKTCYFVLRFSLADKQYKNWSIFPNLVLNSEEIRYTIKKDKEISIYKNHYSHYYQSNSLKAESKMSISINRKKEYYPNHYIDLSKIKDLPGLNKKLSTIMVFQ